MTEAAILRVAGLTLSLVGVCLFAAGAILSLISRVIPQP